MIQLYHHHDLTELAALLQALMARRPPADPLTPETVLVPDRGKERWLQKTLAEAEGIVANMRFPLPAGFIWGDLIRDRLGWTGHLEYQRDRMVWHLYRLLPELEAESPAIARYLAAESREVHRIQLAERLADVFDQYQVFRGDLIEAWDRGEEDTGSTTAAWQAPIWRRLVAELGPDHRVRTLRRAIHELESGTLEAVPPAGRLFFFGVSDLPPDYLRLFYALGHQTEIHLLLPNPSEHYWGDIAAHRISVDFPVEEQALPSQETVETGHPLLASLGRPARDFLHLLYADELAAIQEPELGEALAYTPPEGDRLLERIQRSVITLDATPEDGGLAEDDDSLQIHACHGPLREVQVLHDQLLDLLSRHPDLEPRDIVVMMPDLRTYAPAIRSVFGSTDGARFIPWSLSDQPRRGSHPIVQTFLDVLELPLARWNASHILTLAAVPAIMRRFGLDEPDLDRLHQWVEAAGIRWGRDAENRRRQGAGDYDEFSWVFGLDRLLLGSALDDGDTLVDDVAPWPELEGRDAEILGRLHHLVDTLTGWQETLDAERPPQAWHRLLNELLTSLFAPDTEDPAERTALEAIQEALTLLETAHQCTPETPISWAALHEEMRGALDDAGERQPLLTGGVTFCGIPSLAGIPARVVALLGMDDGAFPRQDGGQSFNLILQRRALGDRTNRDSDRLAFLQALLAARDVFYISYTGTNVRSGEALRPAATVAEFLTYLDGHHFGGAGTAEEILVTHQPMQPFSRSYFGEEAPSARIFTFREEWTPGARTTPQAEASPPPLLDGSRFPAPEEPTIELAALKRFFRHPPETFFREQVGLRLADDNESPSDAEPFELNGLQTWQLRSALLDEVRATGTPLPADDPPRLWRRRGFLPPGGLAAGSWAPAAQAINELLPVVRDWAIETTAADVDCELPGGERLIGRVPDARPEGLRRIHAGELKMKRCLGDWIDYLALLATGALTEGAALTMAGPGKNGSGPDIRWAHLPPDEASQQLDALIALYRDGLTRPLPFLPDLAGEFLEKRDEKTDKGRSEEEANDLSLNELNGALDPDAFQPRHETRDEYLMLTVGTGDQPLGGTPEESEFIRLAEAIIGPLHQRLEAAPAGGPEGVIKSGGAA
ncbi:MAG: exodeoxyribonuclease V subunit gamma [Thiohalospira sp.]